MHANRRVYIFFISSAVRNDRIHVDRITSGTVSTINLSRLNFHQVYKYVMFSSIFWSTSCNTPPPPVIGNNAAALVLELYDSAILPNMVQNSRKYPRPKT